MFSDETQNEVNLMYEGESGEGYCPLQSEVSHSTGSKSRMTPPEKFLYHCNAPVDAIVPTSVYFPAGFSRCLPTSYPTFDLQLIPKLQLRQHIPATAHRPRMTQLFSSDDGSRDEVLRYLGQAGRSFSFEPHNNDQCDQSTATDADGTARLPSKRPRVKGARVHQQLHNLQRRNEFASKLLHSASSVESDRSIADVSSIRDVAARLRAPFDRISPADPHALSNPRDLSDRNSVYELEVITRRQTHRGILTQCTFAPGDCVVIKREREQEELVIIRRVTLKPKLPDAGGCTVLRKAGRNDYLRRHMADKKELEVLSFLRSLSNNDFARSRAEGHRLDVESFEFLDVEAQIDLKRITIFYRCSTGPSTPVQFRPLLRIIFQIFNCRIWMEYVAADVSLPAPSLV